MQIISQVRYNETAIISDKNDKMFENFFGKGEENEEEMKMHGAGGNMEGPITDESGSVLTGGEIEAERKRRDDDPNWIREQK